MHYDICNIKPNIKTTDIYLKTQIYLDESRRFEYYFVWNVRSNGLCFMWDKDCFYPNFLTRIRRGDLEGGKIWRELSRCKNKQTVRL